ncbi:MAG TPA: hypothetical protein VER03_24415 [Bryobacteraceae bacterium]|nr:hypothetical protein [Bryobacteraceae bacterium]
MEPVAKWFLGFEGYLTNLRATEWVGVGVLLCTVTALWTSVRGSRPRWDGPSARAVGLSSLATILFAIWFGVSIHLLIGAVILAVGCGLSFWSLLLRFGVSWREHIRPGITPALIAIAFLVGLWLAPRIAAVALVVLGLWARRTIRTTVGCIDRELDTLSIRTLALTNHEAASYLTNAWFQRFAPHASNLTLLALASEARSRSKAFPRARRIVQASDALHRLATFAEEAVDQRLRTDRAATRTTSWIRVMTLELGRQLLYGSGIAWLFSFAADLVLAVPPVTQESWADRARREGANAPDAEGYVLALIADLPPVVHVADIDALRDRVTRDADSAGPDWLTQVATRAECLREEVPNLDRDVRMEIVAEVLWGVYESALGSRPVRYHLYDQVRLQTPELVQRSSVRDVRVQAESLVMQLDGMPRAFDELGRGNMVIVQTPDDITWSFRRLETTDTGVVLMFAPHGSSPSSRPATTKPARSFTRRRTKEVTTALAAAASQ